MGIFFVEMAWLLPTRTCSLRRRMPTEIDVIKAGNFLSTNEHEGPAERDHIGGGPGSHHMVEVGMKIRLHNMLLHPDKVRSTDPDVMNFAKLRLNGVFHHDKSIAR